jgi:hypothetical protein
MAPKVKIFKINKLNTLVIKQSGGQFFVTDKDSIVIDIFGLSAILKFMVFNNILSHKVLEGILEEYYSYGTEIKSEKNFNTVD